MTGLQFQIAGKVFTVSIEESPVAVGGAPTFDGMADWNTGKIIIASHVEAGRRMDVLLREIWHAWRFDVPQTDNGDGECDFFAMVGRAFLCDLARQGGMASLQGLFDEATKATAAPGAPPVESMSTLDLIRLNQFPGMTDIQWAWAQAECKRLGIHIADAWIRMEPDEETGEVKPKLITTLNNLRTIARNTGLLEEEGDPLMAGPDEQWKDIWLSDEPPVAARCVIRRKDKKQDFVGMAYMKRCCRYIPNGAGGWKPTRAWAECPAPQLGKCAVVAAFRKAFPEILGTLGTKEEDDPTGVKGPRRESWDPAKQKQRRSDGESQIPVVEWGTMPTASTPAPSDLVIVDDPRIAMSMVDEGTPTNERSLINELVRSSNLDLTGITDLIKKLKPLLPRTLAAGFPLFAVMVAREAAKAEA